MSEISRERPERFVLTAELPIRPFVVAAVTTLIGTLVLLVWGVKSLGPGVLAVSIALLAFGIVLSALGLLARHRLQSTLLLDTESITIQRKFGRRRLAWADITEVKVSGAQMLLATKPGAGRPARVLSPRGPNEPIFVAVLNAVRDRLDANRGYAP